MTLLSVNVNKIAVLRNSRGGDEPDVCAAARGVPRRGRARHYRASAPGSAPYPPGDVTARSSALARRPTSNSTSKAMRSRRRAATIPVCSRSSRSARPAQCTLVPDGDAQLTSDHGFDLRADAPRLQPLIAALKPYGCRVSLFMDADAPESSAPREIGADRVEIYTGPYARRIRARRLRARTRTRACAPPNARAPPGSASMPAMI